MVARQVVHKVRWQRGALLVALLAAFALRLTALSLQNIWWDEARNIDVALRPFVRIATAPELDIQPPLYYWLLHLWFFVTGVTRGDAPEMIAWVARFLSAGAGVAGVALTAILARRFAGNAAGVAAATLATLSPFWLAESQETRMYTLGLALLGAAAWQLTGYLRRPNTPAVGPMLRLFSFTLLSAAALLTHYNALFILLAWYVWWGVVALLSPERKRRLRDLLLAGFGTAVLVAPIIPIALRQIPDYANPNLTVPTVADYVRQNWQGHIAGYAWDPALLGGGINWWLWGLLGVAGAGIAFSAVQRLRAAEKSDFVREFSFLLVWLLGGLALYYVAVIDRGAFNVRYSSFVTPALLVLAASGLAGWGRRLWLPLLLVTAMGFIPLLRADLWDPRFAREDIASVTTWLRTEAGPNDVIFVDQKYPFGFYYDSYAIPPQPQPVDGEAAPARYLFVDINTIDQRLSDWAGNAETIYWVQWFESDTDPRHAVPFLLNQAGTYGGERLFQGWRVEWWEMEPPSRFALAPNPRPLAVRFPAAVETAELSLPEETTRGAPLPVVLRWARSPGLTIERPLKARVALYDGADNRLAQADERILNDRHLAPSQWQPEDRPLNVYLLQPQETLPPGVYQVRLLVYDADTLVPLEVVDAAGALAGQEALLGSVVVE